MVYYPVYVEKLFKGDNMDEQKKNDLTAEADGIIEGRNAVIEALRAGETIDKIYILKGETDKTLGHIASKARAAGIVVVDADRRKLDNMSRTHAHQGVIALAASFLSPFLGEEVIAEMTCVGSLLIVALGLNMLDLTKIKVMNLVPAIFLPILLCLFM